MTEEEHQYHNRVSNDAAKLNEVLLMLYEKYGEAIGGFTLYKSKNIGNWRMSVVIDGAEVREAIKRENTQK